MSHQAKHITDLKELPAWQKWTIIGLIVVLAIAFLISGVMVMVIEDWFKPRTPAGRIGDMEISVEQVANYKAVWRLISARMESRLQPVISQYDPLLLTGNLRYAKNERGMPWSLVLERRLRASKTDMTRERFEEELTSRLAWQTLLIAPLARQAGFMVSAKEAAVVARSLLVPPSESGSATSNAANVNANAPKPVVNPDEEARKQEREYVKRITDQFRGMKPEDFEAIIADFLLVKRYVESQAQGNADVALADALGPYQGMRNLFAVDYVRVPVFNPREQATVAFAGVLPRVLPGNWKTRLSVDPAAKTLTATGHMTLRDEQDLHEASSDPTWQSAITALANQLRPWHPEVDRRVQAKLARDRAVANARRQIASATALSNDLLFPDPVEAFARQQLRTGDTYHETQYQFVLMWAKFKDLEPFVPLDSARIRGFYETNRERLFRTTKTPDEIAKQIKAERDELTKQAQTQPAQTQPGQPEVGAAQTQPQTHPVPNTPEAWTQWERKRTEELSYRPLDEVRPEVERMLKSLGARYFAYDVARLIEKEIETRRTNNLSARTHAEQLVRNRRTQAEMLHTLYYGDPDKAEDVGWLKAIDQLQASWIEAVKTYRKAAGLWDDTTPNAIEAQINLDSVREQLDNLARQLDTSWTGFIHQTKFGVNPMVKVDNLLASLERELDNTREMLKTSRAQTPLTEDTRRTIENLEISEKGLLRRIAEFTEVRKAFSTLVQRGEEIVAAERVKLSGFATPDAPRAWLENQAIALGRALVAAITDAKGVSQILQKAEQAKKDLAAARAALAGFADTATEAAANLLPEMGPEKLLDTELKGLPVSLRTLGFQTLTLQKTETFNGALYQAPGFVVPGFSSIGGYRWKELEELEWLKRQLPYWNLAQEWNLDTDSASSRTLRQVLDSLTKGAYSKTLVIDEIGVYFVALIERTDLPMPAVNEIMNQALEDHLENLRTKAAEELARDILDVLNRRNAELRGLSRVELAKQLELASDLIARRGLTGPLEGPDKPYDETRVAALAAALRGERSNHPALISVAPTSQRSRAITEAQALLAGAAMVAVAEKFGVTFGRFASTTSGWFGPTEQLTDTPLSADQVARSVFDLAPYLEFSQLDTETYPPTKLPGASKNRTAYVMSRLLAMRPADPKDRPDLAIRPDLVSQQNLTTTRDTLAALRELASPRSPNDLNATVLSDLRALVEYYATELKKPVVILQKLDHRADDDDFGRRRR